GPANRARRRAPDATRTASVRVRRRVVRPGPPRPHGADLPSGFLRRSLARRLRVHARTDASDRSRARELVHEYAPAVPFSGRFDGRPGDARRTPHAARSDAHVARPGTGRPVADPRFARRTLHRAVRTLRFAAPLGFAVALAWTQRLAPDRADG